MHKLSKKLIDDYNRTSKSVKNAQNKHQNSIDNIKEIITPLVKQQRSKNTPGNWKITSVEIRYDNEIDYDKYRKGKNEYEYIEISESEYDRYIKSIRGTGKIPYYGTPPEGFEEEFVYDYEDEGPEYKEIFKQRIEKRYKYLRVCVYETWRYGGEDWVNYDFLLTEIMDDVGLRKDKLQKLMESSDEV